MARRALRREGPRYLQATPRQPEEVWSWRSRETAMALLLALRRTVALPQPCGGLLLRFLLERAPTLATWSEAVSVGQDLRSAAFRATLPWRMWGAAHGGLVYTREPMAATRLGRYTELRVLGLSGHERCGIVLGVTLVRPGSCGGPSPQDMSQVPWCFWGLPRCSTPPFQLGTLVGYLATWSGELVLFVNGVEMGRAACPAIAGGAELWLVVDLSHDVMYMEVLDSEPPDKVVSGLVPEVRRCLWGCEQRARVRARGSAGRLLLQFSASKALAEGARHLRDAWRTTFLAFGAPVQDAEAAATAAQGSAAHSVLAE